MKVLIDVPELYPGEVFFTEHGETRVDKYLGVIDGMPTYQVTTVEVVGSPPTNVWNLTFGWKMKLTPR